VPQVNRLVAALVGLLVGAGLGWAAVYTIFQRYEHVADNPTTALLTILIGGALPTILGGYLALLLAIKTQKIKRAKNQRAQSEFKFTPRKQRSRRRK
jgi:hypothetical protein